MRSPLPFNATTPKAHELGMGYSVSPACRFDYNEWYGRVSSEKKRSGDRLGGLHGLEGGKEGAPSLKVGGQYGDGGEEK